MVSCIRNTERTELGRFHLWSLMGQESVVSYICLL